MGARLRGRTVTQRCKKGSEKVLGRVLGRGPQKGSEKGGCYGFYSKKRALRRVLRRGSEKAVSRRCLERPLEEYAPLGVRPINIFIPGPGGVGVFHVKGWGPKSSVCPLKPRNTKQMFGGISRNFWRRIQGGPKSLRNKNCVRFLPPIVRDFLNQKSA